MIPPRLQPDGTDRDGTDDESTAIVGDGTAEFDPSTTQETPTDLSDPTAKEENPPQISSPRVNTIILLDEKQQWGLGPHIALWEAISYLGTFDVQKANDPSAAVVSIGKELNQRIIAVMIFGTQETLLSRETREVIQAATSQKIKIILLPTDTPEDSDLETFKLRFDPPRPPTIIKAHDTTAAVISIREEIKTLVSASKQSS